MWKFELLDPTLDDLNNVGSVKVLKTIILSYRSSIFSQTVSFSQFIWPMGNFSNYDNPF